MQTLLTIAQVAKKLNMSSKTLYKWVADKKITYIKLPGGGVRFDEDTLNVIIARRTVKAQKKTPVI